MYNSLSYKTKQFFWLFIKLSIVFGCVYFIYQKLIHNSQLNFSDFYQKIAQNHLFSLKNSFLLFLFTFFNWFLEILKWRTLVTLLTPISLKSATKQSLASLTTSLITPNRIGEYGAKAMFFEKKYRKKILNLNLIGNLHQLFTTVFLGFLGLMYFVKTKNISFNIHKFYTYFLIGVSITTVSFFIWKFFLSKKQIFKEYVVKLTKKQHLKIAFFSFFRYLIFSHQFYFLLLIFKVDISYVTALSAISSLYLISSVIPMLSLLDVVLKGTVALFIFNYFNVNALTILTITTLMWLLNFVTPAILGAYFVLTFKPNLKK